MNPSVVYGLSIFLAIAFHAGVVGLMLVNWEEPKHTQVTEIEPYYIDAMVVKENPVKARERKEQQQAAQREAKRKKAEQKRQAAVRRARLEEEALRKAELEKQQEKEQLAQQQQAEQPKIEVDEDDPVSDAERDRLEKSLSLAVLEEQQYRRAITDDEKAMAYVAQIQREIVQNWSRPPSARNGMEALLRVHLVPTGEVVDVVVEDSSGNDAFDRSALLAVQKAERFVVPDDPRQFERNFREFTVVFRPEDLRL